jgi:hypothetical protein
VELIEVKMDQVWRDRDTRMLGGQRHCRVYTINYGGWAGMAPCRPDGTILSTRTTRVSFNGLRKRWVLVKEAT